MASRVFEGAPATDDGGFSASSDEAFDRNERPLLVIVAGGPSSAVDGVRYSEGASEDVFAGGSATIDEEGDGACERNRLLRLLVVFTGGASGAVDEVATLSGASEGVSDGGFEDDATPIDEESGGVSASEDMLK
ncbi:hypothetical protein FBEOM_7457 [Fusarium beomiforme]|uniref:Uncharacterized protein n=1 Tax=Fusarium beomiforme TaxID=44412 RepID=A0A9P5AH07_9HYPO|nr:hypothetical protein FBEOM_7457 [Fusarium beomiforme]